MNHSEDITITALFVRAAYYWLVDQEDNASHMIMSAVDVLHGESDVVVAARMSRTHEY